MAKEISRPPAEVPPERREESGRHSTDLNYPRGRGPGEFGTHGGPKHYGRKPPGEPQQPGEPETK